MAAPNTSTGSNELGFSLWDVSKIPCFRNSMLIGIAAGTVFGAVRAARTRDVWKAGNSAVIGFSLASVTSWIICRSQWRDRQAKLHQLAQVMKEGSEKKRQARLATDASATKDTTTASAPTTEAKKDSSAPPATA